MMPLLVDSVISCWLQQLCVQSLTKMISIQTQRRNAILAADAHYTSILSQNPFDAASSNQEQVVFNQKYKRKNFRQLLLDIMVCIHIAKRYICNDTPYPSSGYWSLASRIL